MSNKKLRVEFAVSWMAGTTGEYEFESSEEFSKFMEMDDRDQERFLMCAHDDWTIGNTQDYENMVGCLEGEVMNGTIEPADKHTAGYMTWATAISGGAA